MYRTLDSERIIETADRLCSRITERFPESGLSRVARELETITREAANRSAKIQTPNTLLRCGVFAVLLLAAGVVVGVVLQIDAATIDEHMRDVADVVEIVQNSIATLVFLGAAAIFLVTLEKRWKRARALEAIYELRSLAHVVDMHQLTKDPERIVERGPSTKSSPDRRMSAFELGRYLDYSSELLSLISKVAVLYVQRFHDGEVLHAVDQIETLSTSLSRKIWQKIILLERLTQRSPATVLSPMPEPGYTAKVSAAE